MSVFMVSRPDGMMLMRCGWLSMEGMIELTKALKQLERLACPVCRAKLRAGENSIVCTGCSRRYPIVDGIPVLLADRTS